MTKADSRFDFALLQNWPKIRKELMKALNWTNWDRNCPCHACDLVREIRKITEDSGVGVEELT